MKVLDMFCGKGGWSVPFIEDGAHVVGVDIVNLGYPGHLILEDIRNLDGHRFRDYDFIVGSPPCNDFSSLMASDSPPKLPNLRNHMPNRKRGLELISAFNRIVQEAQPKFWAFENVSNLEKFYPFKPIWRFRMGNKAKRSLWGNLPIPLVPEYVFPKRYHNRSKDDKRPHLKKKPKDAIFLRGPEFAMIPYPIACFIADCVKQQISVTV